MRDKLILLREESNETLQQVANALGVTLSCYANYEYGIRKPDVDMLARIATHYNVSADYLIGLKTCNLVSKAQPKTQIQTIYDALSPIQRDMLIAYGQALVDSSKQIDIKKRA